MIPVCYVCTQTFPQAVLGTNPIAFAAPAAEGDSFVLDMATTTVALGKIEVQKRKEQPIPNGWGVDSSGKQTNDPNKVMEGGALLYVGGAEESGGYKGYGLGMMVEVLGGILGGGPYGPHIRKWQGDSRAANLVSYCLHTLTPSHTHTVTHTIAYTHMRTHILNTGEDCYTCTHENTATHTYTMYMLNVKCTHIMTIYFKQGQTFIAVDPEAFAPDFTERMRAFMQEMRGLEPVHKYNYILSSVSLLLILNLFL